MPAIAALDEHGAAATAASTQQPVAQAARAAPALHPHIPSLDGFRFLAAFSVTVAHGYWYVVLMQQMPNPVTAFDNLMLSGAGVGMTLFFVLSGFVIHFNYHKTVPSGRSGKLDFFIARFARLYPLFLLVFGYDFLTLLWSQGYFSGYAFTTYDPFKPLPLYLTFTQTWWWWPIGSTTAYAYYSTWLTGATGAMWSLSTEAFFYFAYLFLAGVLGRLFGWRLGAVAVAAALYGLGYHIAGWLHTGAMTQWVATHYPEAQPDDFTHWMLFQSPWGRISEFLLGAVAAQAVLLGGDRPVSGRTGAWLTYGSFAGLVLLTVAIYGHSRSPLSVIGTQCCASVVAVIIYATAHYQSQLSRIFSLPLLVKLGNASYSLYLLHYFILHDYAQRLAVEHPRVSRWTIYFGMMTLALVLSYVSYALIERPALKWVRANFRPLRMQIWLPATFAVVTLFSVLISVQMRALANAETSQPAGRIAVSSASFGENCDAKLHDNVLGLMRRVCNGRATCAFDYDIYKLRDPADGCGKQFQVLYACGPDGAQQEFLIPMFDRPRVRVTLACK